MVDDDKRQMGAFLDQMDRRAEFEQWRADKLAVANLRNGNGQEWAAYEKALSAYVDDLRQHGTWRDAVVRRADRHLRHLFEVGARALGHVSLLTNPARFVTEGVTAWLRLAGDDALLQRYRKVTGWMRELWATGGDVAIGEPQRERGENKNGE